MGESRVAPKEAAERCNDDRSVRRAEIIDILSTTLFQRLVRDGSFSLNRSELLDISLDSCRTQSVTVHTAGMDPPDTTHPEEQHGQ